MWMGSLWSVQAGGRWCVPRHHMCVLKGLPQEHSDEAVSMEYTSDYPHPCRLPKCWLKIYLTYRQVDKYTLLLPLSLIWMQGSNIASHWAHQEASAHLSSLVWGFQGSHFQGLFSTSQPLLAALSGGALAPDHPGFILPGIVCARTWELHHQGSSLSWHPSDRRGSSPNISSLSQWLLVTQPHR